MIFIKKFLGQNNLFRRKLKILALFRTHYPPKIFEVEKLKPFSG